MLLFRSEEHVHSWCQNWGQPFGEAFSLEQQWGLAQAWYSDRMRPDWRRKTPDEVKAIFGGLGLTSDFWKIDPP